MFKDAVISRCEQYRYALIRVWNFHNPMLEIVMLNPSIADAELDDPTIRRCTSFASRENYGGMRVTNLFTFRATSPDTMKSAVDPIGPLNDQALQCSLDRAKKDGTPVLCAWGAHGSYLNRDSWFRKLAKASGADLVHLGLTKDGQPKHPLYIKADQPFGVFY